MTPLRIALLVAAAVVVLFIGGCALFGLGTNSQGDLGDLLRTPTTTAP
jgi:hypothetical protein